MSFCVGLRDWFSAGPLKRSLTGCIKMRMFGLSKWGTMRGTKVCQSAWLLCSQMHQCLVVSECKWVSSRNEGVLMYSFLMWIPLRVVHLLLVCLFSMDGGQNAENKMLFPIYLHYCGHGSEGGEGRTICFFCPWALPQLPPPSHTIIVKRSRKLLHTRLPHPHRAQTQTKKEPAEDGKMLAFLGKDVLIGNFYHLAATFVTPLGKHKTEALFKWMVRQP